MIEKELFDDLDDRQLELTEHIDMFDLEDFYLTNGPSSSAVCIITKNQMILTETYIKSPGRNGYCTHFDTARLIYKAIYDVDIKEKEYSENGDTIIWQNRIINDGNIVMQLCTKDYINFIWLADDISSDQMEMFENFARRVDNIVNNNPEYFNENPIRFTVYTNDKTYETENSLGEILTDIMSKKRR